MRIKKDALDILHKVENSDAALDEVNEATAVFKTAKAQHQNIVRKFNVSKEVQRDSLFNDILSSKPRQIFKAIKANKSQQSETIKKLKVGHKLYTDDTVPDGFYDSISTLKTLDEITATSYDSFASDYQHILEISKEGLKVPRISLEKAEMLLRKMRPNVSDYYSITAAHFLNGGKAAIEHFQFLINMLLDNIELSSVEELNNVHAVILYKGHGKDRHLSSSYRTISSCPFISKATDIYLGELSQDDWTSCQAATQFQGHGMSHKLASLLLTTTIQHSFSQHKPLFVLLLDAESAFDHVLRQIMVRRLYLDTTKDQRVIFWDQRLANRTTYCQWGNSVMGPIYDQRGVEQGGPNSSEFYKIYNNEQLDTAQSSSLGTNVMGEAVAAIGQADDTALVSNDIGNLQLLLQLTLSYCQKYQVRLSAVKTKLLAFSRSESQYLDYSKLIKPIHIDQTTIEFVQSAEHVGVVRNTAGNMPHILQRIISHNNTLSGLLSMGLSSRHRANPLSSLRAESIYAAPVLFSGVATLILNKNETDTIALHVKETIQKLLKLYANTPDPVVFFLAGVLPGEATLHLKQLTIFGMITRLPDNILHRIAKEMLICSPQSDMTWFALIRELCFKYDLPHPLNLLHQPPKQGAFKSLIKAKVTDFWQQKLREHAAPLTSLRYFQTNFMSLTHPHPMWSAATDSYSVNKII